MSSHKSVYVVQIFQRALRVMAEDGYPLAQLPDVHKLPHFKLWMEWRSGKYWTVKDRGIVIGTLSLK